MKQILYIFLLSICMISAGIFGPSAYYSPQTFGPVTPVITGAFGDGRAVTLPEGPYRKVCSGCRAFQNREGNFILRCESCNGNNSSRYRNQSITYNNPRATFDVNSSGRLQEKSVLGLRGVFSRIF